MIRGDQRSIPFLTPFSDCVDMVENIGEGPDTPGTRWLLYRGGKPVGDIVVLYDNHPYGSGDLRWAQRVL